MADDVLSNEIVVKATPAKKKKSRTLAQVVYAKMREDLLNGVFPPDSKLKLETLLARYEVGMSPLREALSRLVGDMLVRSEGQRGFWVAPLSLSDLDDVLQMRTNLETSALEKSIKYGDLTWESRVTDAFTRLSEVEAHLPEEPSDLDAEFASNWEAANKGFHSALVSACQSPWLMRLRDLMHSQSERYRRISLMASRGHRDVHFEHESIYKAVIDRSTMKACSLIENHMLNTAKEVRQAIVSNRVLET